MEITCSALLLRSMLRPCRAVAPRALLLLAMLALPAAPALAVPPPTAPPTAPPAPAAQTFLPTGEYVLVVDGKPAPDARLYVAASGDAYLVLSARLPAPVLLDVPARRVSTLAAAPAPDPAGTAGAVVLGAAATATPQGTFQVEGDTPAFTVAGVHARLADAPPLLGEQTAAALRRHDPGYARRATAYQPVPSAMAHLASVTSPVRLRVYFGSWCPICAQSVPRLLKVLDGLQKAPYTVELYGLPREKSADPEPARMNLQGLPTAIVYRHGQEVGRITGGQWRQPELALQAILGL